MRLGVMCSGNGTNFENILRTCRHDEVVLMIYNKKKCGEDNFYVRNVGVGGSNPLTSTIFSYGYSIRYREVL